MPQLNFPTFARQNLDKRTHSYSQPPSIARGQEGAIPQILYIFFMFSECAQTFGNLVRNQGPNSPDKRGSKTLDESRISNITTGIKAFRATPNMMIQRMAIAQQPDPIDINLS